MAHAEVEERQLLKAMTWWDGFVVALANPGFLIAALGASYKLVHEGPPGLKAPAEWSSCPWAPALRRPLRRLPPLRCRT